MNIRALGKESAYVLSNLAAFENAAVRQLLWSLPSFVSTITTTIITTINDKELVKEVNTFFVLLCLREQPFFNISLCLFYSLDFFFTTLQLINKHGSTCFLLIQASCKVGCLLA